LLFESALQSKNLKTCCAVLGEFACSAFADRRHDQARLVVQMAATTGAARAGAKPDDVALLHAFNERFHMAIKDVATVKKILGTPQIVEWYRTWKAERAVEKALPDHWRAVGLTAMEWAQAQPLRASRRKLRAGASRETALAARAHHDTLRAILTALQTRLTPTASPIVKVIEAGYPQLAFDRHLAIVKSADRDAALMAELTAARREWLAVARAGKDPLPGWVGTECPARAPERQHAADSSDEREADLEAELAAACEECRALARAGDDEEPLPGWEASAFSVGVGAPEHVAEGVLPDRWRAAGMTPAEWAQAQTVRGVRRALRADAHRELTAAAQAHQEQLHAVAAALETRLAPSASPIVKVIEAGYPQLPAQRRLAVDTSADRKAGLEAELAAAHGEWLAVARAGGDPLPGWVG